MYVHRHTAVLLTTAKHTAVLPSSPGNFLLFFSAAFPNQHVDPEAGETKPSRSSAELCVGHPTDAAGEQTCRTAWKARLMKFCQALGRWMAWCHSQGSMFT